MKRSFVGMVGAAFALSMGSTIAAIDVAAQESTAPPTSLQPVPDRLTLSKLIWSTMAAVDHANKSGNYSVLRDMASPAFQAANNPAALVMTFSGLRQSNLDLSNTLLLAPTYSRAPTVTNGVLEIQGYFGLRPTAIVFTFQYQWVGGQWKLFSIGIQERDIGTQQPGQPDTR